MLWVVGMMVMAMSTLVGVGNVYRYKTWQGLLDI